MKYTVTVKAMYWEEIEVEADDAVEAYKVAVQQFKPTGDNMEYIDVFGLDPWTLSLQDEDPNAVDKYKDQLLSEL